MIQERAWIMDKTYVPFITICPNCGFLTDVDGAFMWNFCPDCGKDMRIPGPFYVPPKEDWIRRFGTNKQIAGYERGTRMMIQGQVSGKELKKWIQFHVDNDTEHTVAALKLRRYLNVGDKKKYFVTPCDLIGKGGVVEGVSLDIRAIKS